MDVYYNEYLKTKKGVVTLIFKTQNKNSIKRGHTPPLYTKKDLKDWLYSQELFHHLFHLWEISGYDKMLKPSIDRIDNSLGYSFSNIQLMTWRENTAKEYRPVLQYSKDGVFINEFISGQHASNYTGITQSNVSRCCSGYRKTAGGFIWKYKDSL